MVVVKGKPKTKGQKQIVVENQSTLQFYRNIVLIANFIYFLSYYFFNDLFTLKQMSLLSFCAVIYVASYQFMVYMARTKYSESGQLIDSGLDLNMEGGIAEHVKDIIILTVGCQVLSILSPYFWFLWLLAPGRAFWLLWVNFLGPYFSQQQDSVSEISEKKQKKLERRMKRQQNR